MTDSPLIPRARILLIDDEEALVNLLREHFTEEGFEVHTALDGHGGLAMFRQCPADIVITDLRMPGADGLAVLAGIKQQDPLTGVIIFTGYGSLETAMAAVRGHASDYVLKPLPHLDYLTHVVERALEYRRLLRENHRLSTNLQQLTESFEAKVTETVTSETRRVKMDFVDLVSHQLRTPLYTVRNALDLLKEQLAAPAGDLQRLLAIASDNIARILALIERLLQLNRLRSVQPLLHVVDLASFLASLRPRLQELVAARGHVLVLRPGSTLVVLGDESLLEQVLLNLLENACQYSPEGTTVTVELREMGDTVRLEVHDQGIGISDEERRYLFEPFYRAGGGCRARPAGTGLGLAIVRAIALCFGGNVGVHSAPGQGSTLWIDLHLYPKESSTKVPGQVMAG